MKLSQALIFFGIVFGVYGLINFYIIRRGLSVIPDSYRTLFLISSIFIVLSYIAGRFLERVWISFLSDTLIWIGSFWIALMFYLFLCLIIIDLLRLINLIIPILPAAITNNPEKAKRLIALVMVIFIIITVAGGFINAKMPVLKTYELNIIKHAGNLKSLNIAMISDVHLGTIIGPNYLERIVNKINTLHPDIILIPGDIIDENIAPILRNNFGETLKQLKAKYGVYSVTGNHEFIGGVQAAVKYLTGHGVTVIRDSAVIIDKSFYVIGREDRAIRQFAGKQRKELKDLIAGVDKSLPIILMDHQPFGLNEAKENEIDLQISGHTHNGQIWPLNYIVERIYELAWGYKLIGNTHYYISCGVGGWGPPVRTGSRPEIVNIKLNFAGE